ncbi:unnamed protein product [Pleuronectes platessa]|uniref:Uncharacterized protein n=1 Tax=Pleuronectes platessa TaxID=8262 RepID=A0A9N7VZ08_PLEPL|nr:unnamed protein product [Pleuronectes platessa]
MTTLKKLNSRRGGADDVVMAPRPVCERVPPLFLYTASLQPDSSIPSSNWQLLVLLRDGAVDGDLQDPPGPPHKQTHTALNPAPTDCGPSPGESAHLPTSSNRGVKGNLTRESHIPPRAGRSD